MQGDEHTETFEQHSLRYHRLVIFIHLCQFKIGRVMTDIAILRALNTESILHYIQAICTPRLLSCTKGASDN